MVEIQGTLVKTDFGWFSPKVDIPFLRNEDTTKKWWAPGIIMHYAQQYKRT